MFSPSLFNPLDPQGVITDKQSSSLVPAIREASVTELPHNRYFLMNGDRLFTENYCVMISYFYSQGRWILYRTALSYAIITRSIMCSWPDFKLLLHKKKSETYNQEHITSNGRRQLHNKAFINFVLYVLWCTALGVAQSKSQSRNSSLTLSQIQLTLLIRVFFGLIIIMRSV